MFFTERRLDTIGQDDVLAGELRLHQGCVRHAPPQDGRVDRERGKGDCDLADNSHKVTSGLFQAISRIMADKVYTSAEFKRERDNFHVRNEVIYFCGII